MSLPAAGTKWLAWLANNYGNLASVISLGVTIIIALSIRNLRRHYNFVGRSDQIVERLREHSKSMTACLDDFHGSANDVPTQLVGLRATLEALQKMSPPEQQGKVKHLMKRVRRYSVQSNGWETLLWGQKRSEVEGLRLIHNDLLYVIQVTIDAQDSIKW